MNDYEKLMGFDFGGEYDEPEEDDDDEEDEDEDEDDEEDTAA